MRIRNIPVNKNVGLVVLNAYSTVEIIVLVLAVSANE
jgi:hypothetical protein